MSELNLKISECFGWKCTPPYFALVFSGSNTPSHKDHVTDFKVNHFGLSCERHAVCTVVAASWFVFFSQVKLDLAQNVWMKLNRNMFVHLKLKSKSIQFYLFSADSQKMSGSTLKKIISIQSSIHSN